MTKDEGIIVVGDPEVKIIDTDEVKLIGEHNLQNICAAITTLWQVSPDADAARQVLTTFSGLEHRLEFVKEVDDVKYFDDSFGTTPETGVVAMRAFVEPKVLIAGGHDKGLDFGPMVGEIIKQRVKHVVAIGDTAERINELLAEKGYHDVTLGLKTMPEIVAAARKLAEPGDVVLLSAGTSSFGLFHDYKDRGDQFKAVVNSL